MTRLIMVQCNIKARSLVMSSVIHRDLTESLSPLSRLYIYTAEMASRSDFELYLITDRGRIAPQSYDGIVSLLPGEDFSIVAQNKSSVEADKEHMKKIYR